MSKVWVTRDKFGRCESVYVWLSKPVLQNGTWGCAEKGQCLGLIHEPNFSYHFDAHLKKGSCKQKELTLKEIT